MSRVQIVISWMYKIYNIEHANKPLLHIHFALAGQDNISLQYCVFSESIAIFFYHKFNKVATDNVATRLIFIHHKNKLERRDRRKWEQ